MKLITAIIKPQKLDAVKEALVSQGITGMTVSEAKGFGRQLGLTEVYRGTQYKVDLIPKIRLEVLVSSKVADKAIELFGDEIANPSQEPIRFAYQIKVVEFILDRDNRK